MNTALIQSVLPAYRQPVFDHIARTVEEFELYVGEESLDAAGVTRVNRPSYGIGVRSQTFKRLNVSWQFLPFRRLVATELLVIEANPRVMSNWPLLVARRILGRQTDVWGHTYSRPKPPLFAENCGVPRLAMFYLASSAVTYTHFEAQRLRMLGISKVRVAPNALYSGSPTSLDRPEPTKVVYIGRISRGKGLSELIDALATEQIQPLELSLLLVGDHDGILPDLQHKAAIEGVRLEHRGPVFALEDIADIYRSAFAAVSGPYVGLNAIQALWFSVPFVWPLAGPHSPEYDLLPGATESFPISDWSSGSIAKGLLNVSWRRKEELSTSSSGSQPDPETATRVRLHTVSRMAEGIVRPGQSRIAGIDGAAEVEVAPPALKVAVIGAQKAGSSMLQTVIAAHPEIRMLRGELGMMDRLSADPIIDSADYQQAVGLCNSWKRPTLIDHPLAAEFLKSQAPTAVVLAVLREPVARFVSAARHYAQLGMVPPLSADDLVRRSLEAIEQPDSRYPRLPELLTHGLYFRGLQTWASAYGENLIVVPFRHARGEAALNVAKAVWRQASLQPFEVPATWLATLDKAKPMASASTGARRHLLARAAKVSFEVDPEGYMNKRTGIPGQAYGIAYKSSRWIDRLLPSRGPVLSPESVNELRRFYSEDSRKTLERWSIADDEW